MSIIRSMLGAAVILGVISSAAVTAATAEQATKPATKAVKVEGTRGFRDEMNRPSEPWEGEPRSGNYIYANYCATCHARTTQGAPLPDDELEWRYRARQGMKVMMKHTIDGYKELMPVRGGCENCSDAEVKAAIVYILGQSGIKLDSIPE